MKIFHGIPRSILGQVTRLRFPRREGGSLAAHALGIFIHHFSKDRQLGN